MEQTIINLLNKYGIDYVPIPSTSLDNIFNYLINNKDFVPVVTIEMLYVAINWQIKNNIW